MRKKRKMATIEEVKQQIQKTQAELREQKEMARLTQQELRQQQVKLPETRTQEALRQRFAGLKGIVQRQQIEKVYGAIEGQIQEVKGYEKKLAEFEKEKLAPVQAEVEKAEYITRAYERAVRLADKFPVLQFALRGAESSTEKKFIRDIFASRENAQKNFLKEIENIQKEMPTGEKLVFDKDKLKIIGVESEQFKQSFKDIESYNKRIEDFNKQIEQQRKFQPSSFGVDVKAPILQTPEYKDVRFKDIDWLKTMAGGEAREGKVLGQEYFERKAGLFFGKAGEKLLSIIPEGEVPFIVPSIKPPFPFEIRTLKLPLVKEVLKTKVPFRYSDLAKWYFFAPAMMTGVQAESEYIYDYSKGKFIKKTSIEKIQKLESLREALKKSSSAEVKEYVKNQLNLLKKSQLSNIEKEKLAKELYALVKESRGDIVVRDSAGNVLGSAGLIKEATTSDTIKVLIEIPPITQMEQIGSVGAGVSTAEKIAESMKQAPLIKDNLFFQEKQKYEQKLRQIPLFRFDTRQKEKFKQPEMEKQKEKLKQIQIPLFRLLQMPKLKYKLRQKQEQRKALPRQPKPKPKPKGRIPPLFKGGYEKTGLIKRKEIKELFRVFVKRKGKDIFLGEFGKVEAEKKLEKVLRGTLARSGFLTQAGKPIKSELLKSPMFRTGKKDIFRVVERRKYALDLPSEKREIQYFRKKAGQNKRKRKTLRGWLS